MIRVKSAAKLRPKASTANTVFCARSYFSAPRFCPTMLLPEVVKDCEMTPHIVLILLKTPARAEYSTPKILIQAMSTILEKLMAADWMAMGIPRAIMRRKVCFSMRKLAGLKSKPKLSRRRYR